MERCNCFSYGGNLGIKGGKQWQVKPLVPHTKQCAGGHCGRHRCALAGKEELYSLKNVLDEAIKNC